MPDECLPGQVPDGWIQECPECLWTGGQHRPGCEGIAIPRLNTRPRRYRLGASVGMIASGNLPAGSIEIDDGNSLHMGPPWSPPPSAETEGAAPMIGAQDPGCPDGGMCHHDCLRSCFRVLVCGPLSGTYPGDEWPAAVRTKYTGTGGR